MNNFNLVIVSGNIMAAPEASKLKMGMTILKFNIICVVQKKAFQGKPGKIEETEIPVVIFGDLADQYKNMLQEGLEITMKGRLTSKRSDKGNVFISFVADDVMSLSEGQQAPQQRQAPQQQRPQAQPMARPQLRAQVQQTMQQQDPNDFDELPF